VTATNILGGFNRKLFVNLVALMLIVIAANTLLLQIVLLLTNQPVATVASALALAAGVGMILAAIGLFRKARWGWLGTLVVSGVMIVLIVPSLFGSGVSGSAILQILVFGAVFLVFLLDSGVKALLWSASDTESAG
jgi:hypothetical protein